MIVRGARCAGASAAMLLACKGYRVLMVDRAIFPSDTFRGYYIDQSGMAMPTSSELQNVGEAGLADEAKVRKNHAMMSAGPSLNSMPG